MSFLFLEQINFTMNFKFSTIYFYDLQTFLRIVVMLIQFYRSSRPGMGNCPAKASTSRRTLSIWTWMSSFSITTWRNSLRVSVREKKQILSINSTKHLILDLQIQYVIFRGSLNEWIFRYLSRGHCAEKWLHHP